MKGEGVRVATDSERKALDRDRVAARAVQTKNAAGATAAPEANSDDRRSRVRRAATAATMTLREARLELASLAAWLQR